MDASLNRCFRDLAEAVFPSLACNDNQQRVRLRVLRLSVMAVKMIEQDNPTTMDATMAWVA